jgi:formylglycine-generating enzyme required for sulfatase activity
MESNPATFKNPNRPVESVTWREARDFARRLSERSGALYRLPTEAEWEYCARAGGRGVFGLGAGGEPISPESLDDHAWLLPTSQNRTHPVGRKTANAWGLHDMLGNVWEWCADWYDPAAYAGGDAGGLDRLERVMRGGAWPLEAVDEKNAHIGLRLVRELTSREAARRIIDGE